MYSISLALVSRPPRSIVMLFNVLLCVTVVPAWADGGRLEINQACAQTGCFAGDGNNFPVTISASGSYVLTSNLAVSGAFVDGVEITADDVSLDLNGFTISGADDNSSVGISIEANQVSVKNGLVRDFTFGINRVTENSHGASSRVTGVTVISSVSVGIRLGSHSLLADCSSIGNGQQGIIMDDGGVVRGCTVADNGTGPTHSGILVGTNSLVMGNTVNNNAGDGIFARAGAVIVDNTVIDSGDNGIEISIGSDLHASIVRHNTSSSNTNYGISSTGNTLIINNATNNNRNTMDNTNIDACATCTITGNHDP